MSKAWQRESGAGEPVHVYPVMDTWEHVTNGDFCSCMPLTNPDGVVVHNAYDARETGEVCRKLIDMLVEGYTSDPSPELVRLTDHALHILDMHWPDEHRLTKKKRRQE